MSNFYFLFEKLRWRSFCKIAFALTLAAGIISGCSTGQSLHSDEASAHAAPAQTALGPERAMAKLKEGNARFLSGRTIARNWPAEVHATAGGQHPYAAIISCMDSRTSTELVFDLGLGEVFSLRVAGNVVNEDILGSLEYAAKVAGTRLIVVLGHSHCGAIKGAVDDVRLGNLTELVGKIKPVVESIGKGEKHSSADHEFVEQVAAGNVRLAMEQIQEKSAVLRELIATGEVKVVGGMYDLDTGKVEFF